MAVEMPTKTRINKVERVLRHRRPDLHVVLEEVRNTHNASAVVRTCDAAGILHLDIIYSDPADFPVNDAISTRAEKWLNLIRHSSASACLKELKAKGFQIVATRLSAESVPYTSIDYTRPTAVIFGNEAEGISAEALKCADHVIRIPMFGMAQSLNLSVSVGIILYEAVRQRNQKSGFAPPQLSPEEFKKFRSQWLKLSE